MKGGCAVKHLGILVLLVCLLGCASMPGMPGNIIETTSKFDGSKGISMEPAWLYNSLIKLALFKNTKMDKDLVILTALVKGAHNFAKGNSLHFNVDGEILSFKPIDEFTDIKTDPGFVGSGLYVPPSNWSSKRYSITKSFIKRIIDAERVVVKIDLRKTYAEGVFSKDSVATARPAFRKFYDRLENF